MEINSFVSSGSGVIIVHEALEKNIYGYKLKKYNPKLEFFPFLIPVLCKNENADIIHTVPDYACFIPKKKSKLIITFHNYVLDNFMQQYSSFYQKIHYKIDLKLFIKKSLEKADVVTAVSKFTANIVKKDLKYKGDIKVIYNGIDTELFKPLKKKNSDGQIIRVLFSGNLTKRKGAHWLVDIAKRLEDNIIIYYTAGLRTRNRLPNTEKLKSIGKIKYCDMPKLYQSMDILLVPTIREGCPLSVLEAMSCGLPIIASNCSSIPELVEDDVCGYLCKVGDVDNFANKINLLSENFSKRNRLSKSARLKILSDYKIEDMILKYSNLFFSI